MIPEVFECPRCERQFVIDSVPDTGSEEVHCPQCSRYLGVRDIAFVLRTELDEMIERLSFEKDRLEKDEAVYSLTDCDPEMRYYGREVSRVIDVLRSALKDLRTLRDGYKVNRPEGRRARMTSASRRLAARETRSRRRLVSFPSSSTTSKSGAPDRDARQGEAHRMDQLPRGNALGLGGRAQRRLGRRGRPVRQGLEPRGEGLELASASPA